MNWGIEVVPFSNDLKGLEQFEQEHPGVKHRIVVCLEKSARRTKSGLLILPFHEFIERLWKGEWETD